MNLADLEKRLFAAARADAPGDHVPYAFEKRILARLTARPAADAWAFWGRALWCAAASCVAIMLILGAVSLFVPDSDSSSVDLSQHFESTVLAAVDQAEDSW